MVSIAKLRAQIQRQTGNLYDTLFTRRVSIYLSWLLLRTSLRPNHISVLGLFVALGICGGIALATPASVVTGVLLFHLYAVLDSVDGEMARYRKDFSLKGLYLEDLSAYTLINGYWIALGLYAYRRSEDLWLLVTAIVIVTFMRNAMPVARRAWLNAVEKGTPAHLVEAPASSDALASGPLARLRGFFENSVMHLTNIWLVTSTVLVLDCFVPAVADSCAFEAVFAFYSLGFLAKELLVLALFLFGDHLERGLAKVYASAQKSSPRQ